MTIPFIQAKNFNKIMGGKRAIRLVVIHSMEAPEKPGTARAVANWFAGKTAPQASAHFCVDDQETIQCVNENDVAWAAPGANNDGVHIELAGYAKQSTEDWDDAYSAGELKRAAQLAAALCFKYGLPRKRLTVAEVTDKTTKGICGHIDVTKAFHGSTHTDPGPGFPWDRFIEMVETELQAQVVAP